MTALAIPQKATSYFGADLAMHTSQGHAIQHEADGSAIVKDVVIFRAGTFRDSMGEQHTWTDLHLTQMAMHFELLRDSAILPDVPVRRDHSYTVDKIMGYFEAMRAVGDKLVADLRITEPDQIQKLARGTYRSRSLELGIYTTNDEASYWPVVFGVAYVDIPAVEGLHNSPNRTAFFGRNTDLPDTKEPTVTTANDTGASRPVNFSINGVETSDHSTIQSHIDSLQKRPTALATFKIAGADVTDAAAVQTHIDSLEAFQRDLGEQNRKNYVAQLATDGKIVEAQTPLLEALALGMNDAQFSQFKAGYDAAPKQGLLANHGSQTGGTHVDTAVKASEKLVLEEQVEMFRNSGMTDERLAQTSAFKRLATINSASN